MPSKLVHQFNINCKIYPRPAAFNEPNHTSHSATQSALDNERITKRYTSNSQCFFYLSLSLSSTQETGDSSEDSSDDDSDLFVNTNRPPLLYDDDDSDSED